MAARGLSHAGLCLGHAGLSGGGCVSRLAAAGPWVSWRLVGGWPPPRSWVSWRLAAATLLGLLEAG